MIYIKNEIFEEGKQNYYKNYWQHEVRWENYKEEPKGHSFYKRIILVLKIKNAVEEFL